MNNQDFNCSITANVTAEEAMDAIGQVSDWWKKDIVGSADALNDEFTVNFSETSFVTFNITEFVLDTKIVWAVTNSYLPWLNDKTEWTGTKVIFEIFTENNQTTLKFTHQGLVPHLECYDMCVKGWTEYVPGSLLKLLTEGVGQPS